MGMAAREQLYSPNDVMRDTGGRDRDVASRDRDQYVARDARHDVMGRDDMQQPYSGSMRDQGRDVMRPANRDYAPEPSRDVVRDNRRDNRGDYGMDIRREYRDMRNDSGRDSRRDDYSSGGLGRLDSRDPRDMPRQYTPDADNYDDQNLLPPVASLM